LLTAPAPTSPPAVSRTIVRFVIEGLGEAEGEFAHFLSPRTIEALTKKMPLEGRGALYMEEVYFETSVKAGNEKPKAKVEQGTIAYWPMGSAVCVFYGSSQPYSPVNILGRITKNLDIFKTIKSGTKITLEKIN
jgi:uncharacterized protein